jgi:hypothetical protein
MTRAGAMRGGEHEHEHEHEHEVEGGPHLDTLSTYSSYFTLPYLTQSLPFLLSYPWYMFVKKTK